MSPDDYYQLFTLHVTMSKHTDNYNFFFQKVLEQDNFQAERIMTDFESGTIKSVKEMLSNVVPKDNSYFFRKIHA